MTRTTALPRPASTPRRWKRLARRPCATRTRSRSHGHHIAGLVLRVRLRGRPHARDEGQQDAERDEDEAEILKEDDAQKVEKARKKALRNQNKVAVGAAPLFKNGSSANAGTAVES